MAEHLNEWKRQSYYFLENDRALDFFFLQWQTGALAKPLWTHAAHVAVSACLTYEHSPETALHLTRSGIIRFNESVGTANTESSGYHETLTRFWSGIIGNFVRAGNFPTRLEAVRSAVNRFGEDRGHFRLFYSFDVVNDRRSRGGWPRPTLLRLIA